MEDFELLVEEKNKPENLEEKVVQKIEVNVGAKCQNKWVETERNFRNTQKSSNFKISKIVGPQLKVVAEQSHFANFV